MAIFKTNNSIADDVVDISPKPKSKKIKVFAQNDTPKCPYHEKHQRHCVDCEKV
jgi:hypothetical protein